jgi:hypothetical protein
MATMKNGLIDGKRNNKNNNFKRKTTTMEG